MPKALKRMTFSFIPKSNIEGCNVGVNAEGFEVITHTTDRYFENGLPADQRAYADSLLMTHVYSGGNHVPGVIGNSR
jgi:hypothetical protein